MAAPAKTTAAAAAGDPRGDGEGAADRKLELRFAALRAELATRARGGDLGGLARLVERTSSELEEPDRYRLQRTLIADCFALAQQAPPGRLPLAFAATAEVALCALQANPSEPLFLNWAGVALYELWALAAAQELFAAALRLDPKVEHAAANLEAVKRRRSQLAGRPEPRLHPAVPALCARAAAVSKGAKPAEGLKLSVCMIVRDEEALLGEALRSVEGVADEVVVVDTGSTDRTVELARSFGARVIEVPWEDSFAAARNRSLEAATGDWILYADERLHAADRKLLRAHLAECWREAFYLREHNLTGSSRAGTSYANDALRLLRNRPRYRFRGRLHEQIAHALPCDLPEKVVRSPVRLEHVGYLQEVILERNKADRNLRLLELERQEGRDDAFLHFNLGTTYAARDDLEKALHHLARAWELLQQAPEGYSYPFAPALASWYVLLLIRAGRPREAVRQAEAALLRFPDHAELLLRLARARAELGEREAALAAAKRCLALSDQERQFSISAGASGFLARTLIGVLALEAGEAQEAALALAGALRENPRYSEAVAPFLRAQRALGRDGAGALQALIETIGEPSPPARFMAACALAEFGERELAEEQYRLVLEAEPEAHEAALALAELRLAAGRLPEALAATRAAGQRPAALRLKLLIELLAGGEGGEVEGLEEEERLVCQRAFAADGKPTLQERCAAPLLALLKRLLELRSFQTFERLLPALAEAIPQKRERGSALAELYLQTGYHRSAAREWLALCAERPDSPALAGLALVALRTGYSDQARELARQALARDPGCKRAQAVLDELNRR